MKKVVCFVVCNLTCLEAMRISNSNKPSMERLYHISYKSHCAIKNSKEPPDNVTLFVRGLIYSHDETYATYSASEYEDGNNDGLEEDYDYDKDDIFDDLEYGDSDSEEKEEQDDAIDFQLYLTKFYVLSKMGQRKSIMTLQSARGSILSILTSVKIS